MRHARSRLRVHWTPDQVGCVGTTHQMWYSVGESWRLCVLQLEETPMSHNEHVADHVVEIAARLMYHPDPEVRELAGEVMRLSQNRPPVGSVAEYNALGDW